MSRSCRNTREQVSIQAAALEREAAKATERIEWAGNIRVHYPAAAK